jgi:hypothetical protein
MPILPSKSALSIQNGNSFLTQKNIDLMANPCRKYFSATAL